MKLMKSLKSLKLIDVARFFLSKYVLGGFTIILGFIGYIPCIDSISELNVVIDAILKSISLFALSFPKQEELNTWLILASFSAVLTVAYLIISIFSKDIKEKFKRNLILKQNNYLVVFGLGEINRTFLDTLDKENRVKTIVVEIDSTNKYINEYKNKFCVINDDAFNNNLFNDYLKYEKLGTVLISLGNDLLNLKLFNKIVEKYEAKTDVKILLHIESKELEKLFMLNKCKDKPINIKIFSFYREVARNIFEKYSIDGNTLEYINSNKSFKTILIGKGKLVNEIIYEIVTLSHFPNENKNSIYLVDENSNELLVKIKNDINFKNGCFPHIDLIAKELKKDSNDFYNDIIWSENDLINIIVANDSEGDNLTIAMNLYNKIYIRKDVKPKIIFGLFNNQIFEENNFDNVYTFGNIKDIFKFDIFTEEKNLKIAKLIHHSYGDEFNENSFIEDEQKLKEKWYKNDFKNMDKKSVNIQQANHIDIKLKSLGLKSEKNLLRTPVELLEINKIIFDEKIKSYLSESNLSFSKIKEYSKELEKYYAGKAFEISYFPEKYTTLFEKMIRMEHNRWSSYQYINGWEYSLSRDDKKKLHNCLLPLEKFEDNKIKITILYDVYSILYIPNYLAQVGYEIVSYE
jgi:hypothetical protein